MKVKIEKYEPTKDWLPHGFYKTTLPILSQPAQSKNDIYGTGFLLDNNGIPYIVTAKHVANIDNPVFLFTRKGRKDIFIHTTYLNQKGIKWNFHPKFDLATIKFPDYLQLQKKLDNYPIIKKSSNSRIDFLLGSTVRH
ncbi:MAG: hypothetical protein ACRD9Q_04080, partial [Nitrososphaeraceae archaeon]